MDAENAPTPASLHSKLLTPIAQLRPDLLDQKNRAVKAEVTLTLSYSSLRKSLVLVIAEPDALLRNPHGQIRVQIDGENAKLVHDSGLGNGDEVLLSLDGAEWAPNSYEPPAHMQGSCSDWELRYPRRIQVEIKSTFTDELKTLDLTNPSDEDAAAVASPLAVEPRSSAADITIPDATFATSPVRKSQDPEFASPAFIKRARLSYGALFEDEFDFPEDDGGVKGKGRKRPRYGRYSNAWTYNSRSPSPEVAVAASSPLRGPAAYVAETPKQLPPRPQMTDEGCQVVEADLTPVRPRDTPVQKSPLLQPSEPPKQVQEPATSLESSDNASSQTSPLASKTTAVQPPVNSSRSLFGKFTTSNGEYSVPRFQSYGTGPVVGVDDGPSIEEQVRFGFHHSPVRTVPPAAEVPDPGTEQVADQEEVDAPEDPQTASSPAAHVDEDQQEEDVSLWGVNSSHASEHEFTEDDVNMDPALTAEDASGNEDIILDQPTRTALPREVDNYGYNERRYQNEVEEAMIGANVNEVVDSSSEDSVDDAEGEYERELANEAGDDYDMRVYADVDDDVENELYDNEEAVVFDGPDDYASDEGDSDGLEEEPDDEEEESGDETPAQGTSQPLAQRQAAPVVIDLLSDSSSEDEDDDAEAPSVSNTPRPAAQQTADAGPVNYNTILENDLASDDEYPETESTHSSDAGFELPNWVGDPDHPRSRGLACNSSSIWMVPLRRNERHLYYEFYGRWPDGYEPPESENSDQSENGSGVLSSSPGPVSDIEQANAAHQDIHSEQESDTSRVPPDPSTSIALVDPALLEMDAEVQGASSGLLQLAAEAVPPTTIELNLDKSRPPAASCPLTQGAESLAESLLNVAIDNTSTPANTEANVVIDLKKVEDVTQIEEIEGLRVFEPTASFAASPTPTKQETEEARVSEPAASLAASPIPTKEETEEATFFEPTASLAAGPTPAKQETEDKEMAEAPAVDLEVENTTIIGTNMVTEIETTLATSESFDAEMDEAIETASQTSADWDAELQLSAENEAAQGKFLAAREGKVISQTEAVVAETTLAVSVEFDHDDDSEVDESLSVKEEPEEELEQETEEAEEEPQEEFQEELEEEAEEDPGVLQLSSPEPKRVRGSTISSMRRSPASTTHEAEPSITEYVNDDPLTDTQGPSSTAMAQPPPNDASPAPSSPPQTTTNREPTARFVSQEPVSDDAESEVAPSEGSEAGETSDAMDSDSEQEVEPIQVGGDLEMLDAEAVGAHVVETWEEAEAAVNEGDEPEIDVEGEPTNADDNADQDDEMDVAQSPPHEEIRIDIDDDEQEMNPDREPLIADDADQDDEIDLAQSPPHEEIRIDIDDDAASQASAASFPPHEEIRIDIDDDDAASQAATTSFSPQEEVRIDIHDDAASQASAASLPHEEPEGQIEDTDDEDYRISSKDEPESLELPQEPEPDPAPEEVNTRVTLSHKVNTEPPAARPVTRASRQVAENTAVEAKAKAVSVQESDQSQPASPATSMNKRKREPEQPSPSSQYKRITTRSASASFRKSATPPPTGDPSVRLAKAGLKSPSRRPKPVDSTVNPDPTSLLAPPNRVTTRSASSSLRKSATPPPVADPSVCLAKAGLRSPSRRHKATDSTNNTETATHPAPAAGVTTRSGLSSFRKSETPPRGPNPSVKLAKAGLKSPSRRPKEASSVEPAEEAPAETSHNATNLKLEISRCMRKDLKGHSTLTTLQSRLGKVLDVIGVATTAGTEPVRTKTRQYAMSFNITDPAVAPKVHEVQIYRAHKDSIPLVKPGDRVLLRGFAVAALTGRGFALRSNDTSTYAVFDDAGQGAGDGSGGDGDDDGMPQIRGPPVEIEEAEIEMAKMLQQWYGLLDEAAKTKILNANKKLAVGGSSGSSAK